MYCEDFKCAFYEDDPDFICDLFNACEICTAGMCDNCTNWYYDFECSRFQCRLITGKAGE